MVSFLDVSKQWFVSQASAVNRKTISELAFSYTAYLYQSAIFYLFALAFLLEIHAASQDLQTTII